MFISNAILSQEKIYDTLNFEILYNYTYQINSENTSDIKSENMVLKIGNHISEYVSYNKIQAMKKLNEMLKNGYSDMSQVPKSSIRYKVVKNNKNEEVIFFNSFGTIGLFYKEPLKLMNWTLINEEKDILSYKCKKAITNFSGRDYEAWYSVDINLPEGPYKFNGLPGLILSITDTKNHHRFEVTDIKKINEVYNLDYEKHTYLSKKEYIETVNKIKNKPSLMAQNPIIQFSKEQLDKMDLKMKNEFKYVNNPIELKD